MKLSGRSSEILLCVTGAPVWGFGFRVWGLGFRVLCIKGNAESDVSDGSESRGSCTHGLKLKVC